ncbi:MAG: hypothetical protein ACR2G4_10755, partial [Pyrinomonadaceae bacterium]
RKRARTAARPRSAPARDAGSATAHGHADRRTADDKANYVQPRRVRLARSGEATRGHIIALYRLTHGRGRNLNLRKAQR